MHRVVDKTLKHFHNDSLFRNSIYLMMSTFMGAFFGFFFWIIAARLYNSSQVGLATAMISVTSLITGISMLGFNNGIIRYLPKAPHIDSIINTSFTVVGVLSVIVSIGYLMGIHQFSPALQFITKQPIYIGAFILIMLVASINSVSDSVFVAKRDSLYVLIYNFFLNITKQGMLFALIAFGAIGIYLSVFSGIFVAFFLTFVFLYTRYKYTFSLKVDNVIAKELLIFSSKNYLANFINALPMQLLPIIVLNRLGPKYAAYYYIATMVANTIYIIPSAISRSFFAEGAHNEAELKKLMFKAAKMIIIFLVPAVFAIVFLGKYILLAFGKQFSDEAFTLLQLFALTALLLPINSIGSTILNIKGKMGLLTVLCVMNALIILVPVYLLPQVTLLSIGYVWLISHVVIALLTVLFMYFYFYRKQ